jgi:hypothetical protein
LELVTASSRTAADECYDVQFLSAKSRREKVGGRGSGGWNDTGRATVEETTKLAMPVLRGCGVLEPGAYVILRWHRGVECCPSVDVHGEHNGVRLTYSADTDGSAARVVEEFISLERRPCRFGGTRAFFLCPRCTRRALHLHLSNGRFVCRVCAQLTYASRRERERDRHLRAANKLRRRLGGEAGAVNAVPARPLGMWRRTYERIASEISRREGVAKEELAGWLLERRDAGRRRTGRFW